MNKDKIRNLLNIIFMIGAIVGVIYYLTKDLNVFQNSRVLTTHDQVIYEENIIYATIADAGIDRGQCAKYSYL